jgi:hypothetical protein
MHRIVVLVSLVTLVLLGARPAVVESQAAMHDGARPTADSPLVGAWWWENISDDPFDDSYAILHADGTYVEETSYIGAGIGSWEVTGERSADLTIVFQDIEGGLDPDEPAAFTPGTVTFWLSLELDETGDTLTATGPVEIRSPDGTLVDQFTFNGSATRLAAGRDRPSATPTP